MNLLTKPVGQKISICEAVRRKIHNYPLDSTILRELRSMRNKGYNWECIDRQKAKYKKSI